MQIATRPYLPAARNDGDFDVSEMQTLSPVDRQCQAEAYDHVVNDINVNLYIPCNAAEHGLPVYQFRLRILHDWIHNDRAQRGLFDGEIGSSQLPRFVSGRGVLAPDHLC
jgi:hypothetical protein